MRAAVQRQYGGPEVVRVEEVPDPTVGPGQIGVRVLASTVTTADHRLRAADFPLGMRLLGRLAVGAFRPRNPTLGMTFAGRVEGVAPGVTRFAVGDLVFGFCGGGGHAERLVVKADGPVAQIPTGLTVEEAASVTFGGITALVFVRDVAKVRPGESVLVLGAGGECGGWLVQMAHHFGARVTASSSPRSHEQLRQLGADVVVDRHQPDALQGPFDVVVDAVGAMSFAQVRRLLTPTGRFAPLVGSVADAFRSLWTRLVGGQRLLFAVATDTQRDLAWLAERLARKELRPVVDRVFPLDQIQEAHRYGDQQAKRGAIVVRV